MKAKRLLLCSFVSFFFFVGLPSVFAVENRDERLLAQIQNLREEMRNIIPIGTILPYSGGQALPPGYLECNGKLVNRRSYRRLFAVIGTTFSTPTDVAERTHKFRLPNLNGQTLVGKSDTIELGSKLGSATQILTPAHLPPHQHGGMTEANNRSHTHTGLTGDDSPDHTHVGGHGPSFGSKIPGDFPMTPFLPTKGHYPDLEFMTNQCAKVDVKAARSMGLKDFDQITISTKGASNHHQHPFTTARETQTHQHPFTTDNGAGLQSQPFSVMQPSVGMRFMIKAE
jgi:microcystin-dependent protein